MNRQPALRRLLLASVGFCLAGLVVCAQEASPKTPEPPRQSHRFLLVVDTSRSMKAELSATLDLLGHLIATGLDGRMSSGDTMGLWTFSGELETGAFPLQVWTPEKRQAVAEAITRFIQGARFSGSTNLKKPLLAAMELVMTSDAITIVLITDGDSRISGTPYDSQINEAFKQSGRRMRSAGLPFALFLEGRRGLVMDFAINSETNRLVYPPSLIPVEPRVAPAPKTDTPVAHEESGAEPQKTLAQSESDATEGKIKSPGPATRPPATVKSEREPKPESTPEIVAAVPKKPEVINPKGSVVLPQPTITTPKEPNPVASTKPADESKPVLPAKPVVQSAASAPSKPPIQKPATAAAATATVVAKADEEGAKTEAGKPSSARNVKEPNPSSVKDQPEVAPNTVPAPSGRQPTPLALAAKSQSEPVIAKSQSEPVIARDKPRPLPAVPPPSNETSVASPTESAPIAGSDEPGRSNLPLEPGKSTAGGDVKEPQTENSVAVETPMPAVAGSGDAGPSTNKVAPVVAVIPPESNYSARALLIAAFTLLGVAGVLMYFMMRRPAPAKISLITRSMNRDGK